jgi:hypothetical protein
MIRFVAVFVFLWIPLLVIALVVSVFSRSAGFAMSEWMEGWMDKERLRYRAKHPDVFKDED